MQNSLVLYLLVGLMGGLHRACWGGYKDSLYEPFKWLKFIRSILVGGFWGGVFYFFLPKYGVKLVGLAYLYLMVVALDTITTEFYKLFVRVEPQKKYLIPSQFHFIDKKVSNRFLRLVIGLSLGVGLFWLFNLLLRFEVASFGLPPWIVGMGVGLFGGFMEAIGGSWKDAPFEKFFPLKFFRSPTAGLLWGLILSLKQTNLGILFIAILGADRMIIELYKGFIKGMKSGKFKTAGIVFADWGKKRKLFVAPYIFTWLFFIILWFWSE
jgi:hypothetical protein